MQKTDELPLWTRIAFAAGSVGAWGPVVSFSLLRTTLYVIYLGADPTAMGAVGVVMGWYNALNGPFVAAWSDAGALNKLSWFPKEKWGRRTPWLILGTPLVILGTALPWLPPAKDNTSLVLWYAFCYFLTVNGVTAQLQSYLSSIPELFTTAARRSKAIAMQTPFLVITYIITGVVIPLIAFSFSPDTTDACCIARRPTCVAQPSCVCFLNETQYDAALPLSNDSAALSLYAPNYADACSADLGPGGDVGLSLFETNEARTEACAPTGDAHDHWARFAAAAATVAFMGSMALLAVPAMRRTPVTLDDAEKKPMRLWQSMKLTFGRAPFRIFTSIMFLEQVWGSHIVSNLPLYLLYVVGLESSELGQMYAILVAVALVTRFICTPLFAWLLKQVHPGRVFALLQIAQGILVPILFAMLKSDDISITVLVVLSGMVAGVCSAPNDMVHHMMMGWVIDEDAFENGGLRREGMFWACNGVVQHTSEVVISLLLAAFGAAGLDARLCASAQPESARNAIEYSFVLGAPLLGSILGVLGLVFPIRGERLEELKEKVAALDDVRATRAKSSDPFFDRKEPRATTVAIKAEMSPPDDPDEIEMKQEAPATVSAPGALSHAEDP